MLSVELFEQVNIKLILVVGFNNFDRSHIYFSTRVFHFFKISMTSSLCFMVQIQILHLKSSVNDPKQKELPLDTNSEAPHICVDVIHNPLSFVSSVVGAYTTLLVIDTMFTQVQLCCRISSKQSTFGQISQPALPDMPELYMPQLNMSHTLFILHN